MITHEMIYGKPTKIKRIVWLITEFFSNKKPLEIIKIKNPYEDHEQLFIEKVIELLKTNPGDFSARWFNGRSLDKSIRSSNMKVLILIENGQILKPIEPKMSPIQKQVIQELLAPIVKADSEHLITEFISK